jgi:hypothetical protein
MAKVSTYVRDILANERMRLADDTVTVAKLLRFATGRFISEIGAPVAETVALAQECNQL